MHTDDQPWLNTLLVARIRRLKKHVTLASLQKSAGYADVA
jgi:hypothetical protein